MEGAVSTYDASEGAGWREGSGGGLPLLSRKRATLLSCSFGREGRISAAVSMSPRSTAVWYSTTEREREYP